MNWEKSITCNICPIQFLQKNCNLFKVWNNLQQRRQEVKRKLRHPQVELSENIVRDDLADLRSMLSRDYAILLTGLGDAKRFHHMHNENNVSLSDKDRKLFEVFVLVSQRVIWIALKRKYIHLIGIVNMNFISPLSSILTHIAKI